MSTALAPSPPEISGSIASQIDQFSGAIVIPPPEGDRNRPQPRLGVLTASGEEVENSITWRGENRVSLTPAMPPASEIQDLAGRWIYMGPLFGHFGHFMVESIARLWALREVGEIDGVVFVPKFHRRPQHILERYLPLLRSLGVGVRVVNLEVSTRVENLFVPVQGFGLYQMIDGAPEFRDYMRQKAFRDIAPCGPEKVYISRTQLPPARGCVLGEDRLESWLEAEGYAPFHPQKHDLLEQVAAYKSATHIVSLDCSPLHLVALAGNPDQKVGIIARRSGDFDQMFARQIRAFTKAQVCTVNALVRNLVAKGQNRVSRESWGELDFARVYTALCQGQLVGGQDPWRPLSQAEARAAADAAGERAGTSFQPLEF